MQQASGHDLENFELVFAVVARQAVAEGMQWGILRNKAVVVVAAQCFEVSSKVKCFIMQLIKEL